MTSFVWFIRSPLSNQQLVSVVGFDEFLSILENKSRRDILELLTKEPHYALQISELLHISQQAVVKHLDILETAGFVSVEKVPSEKGGPPKKIYKVTESYCLSWI